MQMLDTTIVHHEILGESILFLKVRVNRNAELLGKPGQFYQIRVDSDEFELRIPISIYDIDPVPEVSSTTEEQSDISFLIKIIGDKTRKIGEMKVNDTLNIIGPLGNSFIFSERERYMFISGGCGYAPLNFLYKFIPNENITWIHGGRTKKLVEYAVRDNKVHIITTDDGSEGVKGYVTTEVSKELFIQRYDKVFACGPNPMLREVISVCRLFNKKLFVSMEAMMACGIGTCHGCALKIRNTKGKYAYARVCKDGPIFNAYTIAWEDIT